MKIIHTHTNIFRNKCHALAISWLQALPHFLWTTTSSIHITHSFHILEPSCPLTFTCQMDLQGHHTQQYDSIVPPETRVYFCIHPGKLAWNLKIPLGKGETSANHQFCLIPCWFSGVLACSFCIRKTSPTSPMIHLSFLQLSSSSTAISAVAIAQVSPAWCTGTRWPEIKESTFLLTNMSPPKITQGMFEAVFSLEGTRPSFDFHVIFSRVVANLQLMFGRTPHPGVLGKWPLVVMSHDSWKPMQFSGDKKWPSPGGASGGPSKNETWFHLCITSFGMASCEFGGGHSATRPLFLCFAKTPWSSAVPAGPSANWFLPYPFSQQLQFCSSSTH